MERKSILDHHVVIKVRVAKVVLCSVYDVLNKKKK